MDEIFKVKISIAEEDYHENWCRRCDKYFCFECVEFYEVDFDIEENINVERLDLKPQIENWKEKDYVHGVIINWWINIINKNKGLKRK